MLVAQFAESRCRVLEGSSELADALRIGDGLTSQCCDVRMEAGVLGQREFKHLLCVCLFAQ